MYRYSMGLEHMTMAMSLRAPLVPSLGEQLGTEVVKTCLSAGVSGGQTFPG